MVVGDDGVMDLDSALLRAFVTVAEELHFGRAAERLFISQQALSKRVARLEKLLGIRLFDRGRRAVALSAGGQQMLPQARTAVDAVDAATRAAGVGRPTLTVDVLDEHLAMLPRVRAVNRSENDLGLSVVMRHDARDVLTMLRGGAADIALGRPGSLALPWPADIRGAEVLVEPIRLLVPVGHPLDRPGGVAPAELAGHSLWFPTVGAPAEWTDLLAELVATFDLDVDRRGSTFGFDHWVGLVAEGSAPVSFIGAAMDLPAQLPVSQVPIVNPTPAYWWWAMWRRRSPAAVVTRFLDALQQPAASINQYNDRQLWLPRSDRPFRP